MKFIDTKIICLVSLIVFTLSSCETDFDNPNSATSEQTFSSREGIVATAVGMQQLYSTTGLRYIIETPAITTREGGITTTFQNMIELEDGGSVLPDFNSNVQGLWATMLRIIKVAEDIETNVANIDLEPGTASGLLAHAKLFKAMAIGSLSQHYEQVIVQTSNENDAEFVSRLEGYATAIALLNEAQTVLAATPASSEFIEGVTLGNIDLDNTIKAFSARYNLFAGNYDAALTSAQSVDLSSVSNFVYDSQNLNPLWSRVFLNDSPNFKPRDNFGLPSEFVFEEADGRLAFYLVSLDETNQNGLPIEDLAGFFNTNTGSIPLYIPDEMNLIIAEANLRKATVDINAAETALNEVLTDTDDPVNINANAAPYAGVSTSEALLDAVYQNRRAELFLTGLSLEDSRRFDRPEPSETAMNYDEERNRNFYPYPETERNSNPNTPNNPSL
ncbi:putative outer membrane starch-binding protein [Flavobacteriaceae bacterium MAR_2009_75]|nr:putative outer membrane starch-binding protein [Flavobacteriaceae bacterium MAR_2009_75]